MAPEARLESILWQEQLFGFAPFSRPPISARMVCFSESPLDHIKWLIGDQGWPPWALIVSRQQVYNLGGGPVWHARQPQYVSMSPDQRAWAVRLDTSTTGRSEWMHEREWRLPVPPATPWLSLNPSTAAAVLLGDPEWHPSWQLVWQPTGRYFDGETGVEVLADHRRAQPWLEQRLAPPRLWPGLLKLYWDAKTGNIFPIQ
jgi:hypothetical protein